MKQIYTKTAKGTEEIKTRAGGLIPRVRQALIFVDGRRSTDDLYAMLKAEDLAETLALLVEQGYIELSTPVEPAAPVAPAPVANAAGQSALELALAKQKALEKEEREALELEEREARELSRNFMSKM
ncbi:hypothetical protein BH11PSE11_BH11PSE11_28570 [soil metagenome]